MGQSVLSHWRLIFIIRYGAMVIIRTNKERKKNILWSGVRKKGERKRGKEMRREKGEKDWSEKG